MKVGFRLIFSSNFVTGWKYQAISCLEHDNCITKWNHPIKMSLFTLKWLFRQGHASRKRPLPKKQQHKKTDYCSILVMNCLYLATITIATFVGEKHADCKLENTNLSPYFVKRWIGAFRKIDDIMRKKKTLFGNNEANFFRHQ